MKRALVFALLVTLPGCTSLSVKGERVRLTTSPADVTDCRAVGDVAGTIYTVPDLKNQAVALGADVVLYRRPVGWGIKGKAYDCGGRYAKGK